MSVSSGRCDGILKKKAPTSATVFDILFFSVIIKRENKYMDQNERRQAMVLMEMEGRKDHGEGHKTTFSSCVVGD